MAKPKPKLEEGRKWRLEWRYIKQRIGKQQRKARKPSILWKDLIKHTNLHLVWKKKDSNYQNQNIKVSKQNGPTVSHRELNSISCAKPNCTPGDRVEGCAFIFSCESSKIESCCWTIINSRMLDWNEKHTPCPRAKEKPQRL